MLIRKWYASKLVQWWPLLVTFFTGSFYLCCSLTGSFHFSRSQARVFQFLKSLNSFYLTKISGFCFDICPSLSMILWDYILRRWPISYCLLVHWSRSFWSFNGRIICKGLTIYNTNLTIQICYSKNDLRTSKSQKKELPY